MIDRDLLSGAMALILVAPAAAGAATQQDMSPRRIPLQQVSEPAAPATMRVGAGGWGIRLGTFRDRAAAEARWTRLSGKLPGAQPFYSEANGLIGVQATGYATRAAAEAACRRAGLRCALVAP